jgi:DNA ligase (NAD+)
METIMFIVPDTVQEMETEVRRHSELYYNGMPEITDAEFDLLVDALTEACPTSEALVEVGAIPTWGRKVKHPTIMGSLSKENECDKLFKWYSALPASTSNEAISANNVKNLVASPKVDGLAVRLRYSNGKLVEAATRGDGEVGQDVLENVKRISSVPQTVADNFTGEVRGEVYMRKDVWKSFGSQFANPRNGASGGLLQKNADETERRNLNFLAYSIKDDNNEIMTESLAFVFGTSMGFEYVKWEVVNTLHLEAYLLEWEKTKRDALPYQIDGLVFTVDEFEEQEEAGWNGKRPRGKIAWKFPAEQREASVLGCTWQVGRTGQLTPVLHIEPTHIDGSTISNVSLASRARFEELGLSKSDKVLVEKGGDIIPQVVRVTYRPLRNPKLEIPNICPACNSAVESNGAHVFCRNAACESQLNRRVLHWLKMLDIKGAGPSVVSAMCSQGLVVNLADLYYLRMDDLSAVLGSRKIAENIINEIMMKSEIPLWKFMAGLGISSLGRTASKAITKHYSSIEEIIEADKLGLSKIEGIGVPTAKVIIDGLIDMTSEIQALERVLDIEVPVRATGGALYGMSFCLTGKMSRDRKLIASDIEAHGGDVKSSVGRGLNFLVQSDPTSKSSKTQKAEKFGTKIIGEDELLAMMGV